MMYLVTIENDEGMWWEEPVAANDRLEAIGLSRGACPQMPAGYARVLYECRQIDEVDQPTPSDAG